ncbi:MAG: hypothetical protein R2752_01000 [Vicinamibacterales bacterium]
MRDRVELRDAGIARHRRQPVGAGDGSGQQSGRNGRPDLDGHLRVAPGDDVDDLDLPGGVAESVAGDVEDETHGMILPWP